MKNKGRKYYIENMQKFSLNCRCFRLLNYYSLRDIAKDLDYQPAIINKFERGLNNNAIVYNWYIQHGYNHKVDYIKIWCEENKRKVVKFKEYLDDNIYQLKDKEASDMIKKQYELESSK